jgi:DNA-binding transcriptional MocR family regulator
MARGRLAARALVGLLGEWRGELPAYEGLAERIRLLLIDGRISADVRLPSERELSERLQVSRTTITAAYRRLRESGYATSLQGSGTTTTLPPSPAARTRTGPHGVDLAMAALPATRLLADAARRATAELAEHYSSPGYHLVGVPGLRQAVADRYTARGLPTEPSQVVVTTGAQSAIDLVARSVLSRGDRAFAESPSYPHAYDALRAAGARVVTSPVTCESGWDVDALVATIARTTPALAYVMPDFHNPTSRSMTGEDRRRLLEVAARTDTVVVADETTAELDIDRPASFGPLGSGTGSWGARVVHIGSASKLLWGGLRIGWIRASREVLDRVTGLRLASDLGTPVWEQLVAGQLVARADEVVEERRIQLLERRDVLYQGLKRHLPDWELPPELHGGLAAWTRLPAPVSSQLTLAARAAGLHVTAGPRFGADGAYERHIRLPLTAEPDDLTRAVELLGALWPSVAAATTAGPALPERMV